MAQQAVLVFENVADAAVPPGPVELAGVLILIVPCSPDDADMAARPISEVDADYCRARAEVEAIRAEEAAHPAARDAHLEMAALYRQRACGSPDRGPSGFGLDERGREPVP